MTEDEKTTYSDRDLEAFNKVITPFLETIKYIDPKTRIEKVAVTLTKKGFERYMQHVGIGVIAGDFFSIKRNRIYGTDGYEAHEEKINQWADWSTKQKEIKKLENLNND